MDAVVTADAAHAQHDTAEYVAGERGSDYLLQVKGNQPGLQRAIYDTINAGCGTVPDHVAVDYGHGRIIRRSIWVTGAGASTSRTPPCSCPYEAQVTNDFAGPVRPGRLPAVTRAGSGTAAAWPRRAPRGRHPPGRGRRGRPGSRRPGSRSGTEP